MTKLDTVTVREEAPMPVLGETPDAAAAQASPHFVRLERAFQAFHHSAERLGGRYVMLTEALRELEDRLDARNRELQSALAAERDLRERLHTVVESLGAGLLVADANGAVTLSNRAARQLLAREQLEGATLAELLPGTLRVVDGARSARRPSPASVAEVLAELTGTVIAEGAVGSAGRTQARLVLTRHADSAPESRLVVVLHDETRLKKLEGELRRRDRLAAVGTASGQIVHQIRSPVTSLELLTSLLADQLGADPVHGEIIQEIRQSLGRLERTLSNLLHFLGSGRIERHSVPIRELMERALRAVPRSQIQSPIEFRIAVSPVDLQAAVDPELLEQVLMNLITNAVQAMPNGGSLALGAEAVLTETNEIAEVRLTVEDTGAGIPAAELERIFDPFVTGRAHGTGLGLTLVHNVVEAHGGTLEIQSEVGRGTRVTLLLPTASEPSRSTPTALLERPHDSIDA